jgi:dCMP deaminase
MLIGLTGRNAAGKGEVAKYLQTKSFYYYSLSDAIRAELRARKREISREALIQVGNELRQRFGPSILADRIVELTQPDRNYVIDSIRNPAEVAALRKACKDFKLIRVDAPVQARFERTVARRRENDPVTLEDFVALDERESRGEATSQNLAEVERLADEVLLNDASLTELHPKIDMLVGKLLKNVKRPGWDQYFMDIARVVASRSNCMKRKVAAVIVLDKRIISTGYNGTPRGTRNCNEGGCPRCNNMAASGTGLDECLCSHGEENAIVQASYHGVSLKDSTIYSTFAPCLMCAKMIINSGIREVVYNLDYPLNDSAFRLFRESGIAIRQLKIEN